jgi:hypothetical protein
MILGITLASAQLPEAADGVTLVLTGLENGAARPGGHAAIGYVLDPDAGTATAAWGMAPGQDTWGTGSAPGDFAADDGGTLWLTVTDGEATRHASAPIRHAPGTAPAIPAQSWTVDAAASLEAGASGPGLIFVHAATGLPAGLSIAPGTGRITGVPTGVGTGTAEVAATDQYGRTLGFGIAWTTALRAQASAAGALPDRVWTVDDTAVDLDLAGDFAANGNTLSFAVSGLPAGVSDDGDGTISGIPAAVASGPVTVLATDEYGRQVASGFSHATALRAPAAADGPLGPFTLVAGQAFSEDLSGGFAAGGNTLSFAIQGGALPAGATLSPAGVLGGTVAAPVAAETFTIGATDEYGRVTTRAFTLEVTTAGGGTAPTADGAVAGPQDASGDLAVALSNLSGDAPDSRFILTAGAQTTPSAAQVRAGTDETGAPAAASGSFAVTQAGPAATVTGLSVPSGRYHVHVVLGAADGSHGAPIHAGAVDLDFAAPVLTSATAVATGATTAAWEVLTDSAGGTIHAGARPAGAAALTAAQLVAGAGGAGLAWDSDGAVTADPWSPARLFAGGEAGAWFDPSDLSTLAQNSDGTGAVAIGDPVGYMADLSGNGNHATQGAAGARPVLRQTAGGLFYLEFDGVDDWMQSPVIDLTGTDRVSVFAGLRKLTPVGSFRAFCEFGPSTIANNGSFLVAAPSGLGDEYRFNSRGTIVTTNGTADPAHAAPHTGVLTAISEIGTPINRLRVNGAPVSTATDDQGTGSYGAHRLFLGARAGASNFFAGHLFGLVLRGATAIPANVEAAEAWMAARTGTAP